jgi:opacity protein-like surface antigen
MIRTSFAIVLSMCFVLLLSNLGSAEMYIAGQVGYAMPSDLSDVKGTGSSSGVNSSDLSLKNNIAYGLKVGGYFPGVLKWLGVEVEGFYNQPDIKSQTVTFTPGGPQSVNGTTMRVAHFAANVLVRYPGETFQPYIGVGGGVNVAGLSENSTFDAEATVAPALNVLAGMRAFITERIALFGEFKYNQSTFKFSDNEFDAKYRTTMFMGGLSFHFK